MSKIEQYKELSEQAAAAELARLGDDATADQIAGKLPELETFLRTAQADQGGEATFERWVRATAADANEFGLTEAGEYLRLGGDLRNKDLGADGQWKLPESDNLLAPWAKIADGIGRKLPEPLEADLEAAEKAFGDYDFGIGVEYVDSDEWAYTRPGNEMSKKVWVETEQEDDGPHPRYELTFTVRMDRATGLVAEAYAIDQKGQIWGSMPNRKLPQKATAESETVRWSAWFDNPFKAIKAAAEACGKPEDHVRALDVLRASAEWENFSLEPYLDDVLQEIAGETNIVCQLASDDFSGRRFRAAYDDVPESPAQLNGH